MNKVILNGRLGKKPESKKVNETTVCNFSIATNSYGKDKDGNRKTYTQWHNVVVWGKLAENCAKYLEKGQNCLVEGSLETRSWDDKDGNKRYTTEVVVRTGGGHSVEFGDKGQGGDSSSSKSNESASESDIQTESIELDSESFDFDDN